MEDILEKERDKIMESTDVKKTFYMAQIINTTGEVVFLETVNYEENMKDNVVWQLTKIQALLELFDLHIRYCSKIANKMVEVANVK
jgi:hypothetical protein